MRKILSSFSGGGEADHSARPYCSHRQRDLIGPQLHLAKGSELPWDEITGQYFRGLICSLIGSPLGDGGQAYSLAYLWSAQRLCCLASGLDGTGDK